MKVLMWLTSILLVSGGYSSIHTINTFSQAKPYLKDLNSDSLVIFDVDGVISMPKNPCLRGKNFAKYRELFLHLIDSLSVEEKDYFIGLLATDSGSQLVEESISEIIRKIKFHQAKVIALTAIPSGKIDNIENMTIWRQKQLFNHGIDLSSSFQEDKLIVLDEFSKNLNSYPSFFKGILTANGIGVASKGDVLVSFLNKMQYMPRRIIFFDDHLFHLESVEKAISIISPSTSFIGFHYLGAEMVDSSVSLEDFVSKVKELVTKVKEQRLLTNEMMEL